MKGRIAEVARDLGSPIRSIAVAPDAVLAGTAQGPIHVLGRDGTSELGTLPGHAGGTDSLAVEPGGKHLASGGQDRAVRIWRRADKGFVPEGALAGIEGDTHFLAYTPSGDRLVAAGNDGAVISWAVRDGKPDPSTRQVIAKHTGAVTSLLVGDRTVISAGRDLAVIRYAAGATTRATLTSAAIQLVESDGLVLAVTRTGAVWRWDPTEKGPVLEIDHGVTAATAIPGSPRWLLAFDDGAVLFASLARGNFAELRASIAAATSYRLPPH